MLGRWVDTIGYHSNIFKQHDGMFEQLTDAGSVVMQGSPLEQRDGVFSCESLETMFLVDLVGHCRWTGRMLFARVGR